MKTNYNNFVEFNQEIKDAINNHLPVVALESTIISHGMPYPQNIEMAHKVEEIVRENGAIPATIAIMDGKIKIGINEEDLKILATNSDIAKVSRRDIAAVIASKGIGATTVAATMLCANMAGIKFFVTGGIGGVHREYEKTLDVSADLEELAQTPVTVICAGAKSILDLPRTLEYLETKGVPVIGFKTDELPAFFTRNSGLKLNLRLDSVEEIAKLVYVQDTLKLKGGILVANPIPEESSLDKEYIDSIIDEAIEESEKLGVKGKDLTPFLLKRIVEKTEGKSLEANLQLVYNNAKIGSRIAAAYSKLPANCL
ncbi:pseudouridine-5'-phosphate glycosidase [Tepidanaerobacter syntrophicus]|uniref:pseudouridine-5'-phosphate glycosidase n=1 Tax=Tepidanaerobacter syntrophicus TaxID=224999 RepID=UPI0022EF7F1C|nr:pseudouridine-5'-phosphate glycosidase [Tepidanaerobacter syntrophicus]GLI50669.1 pseudouridine-5'-phosphate glycosidase [Tepidanaerobacter syntrophicus]